MRSALVSRLCLLIPALVALVWFWSALSHGWRSDDFLTVYYFDRDAGAVHWGRCFEEWARPWFGVRDLYRPLVSCSYGLNWAFGTQPCGFHLFNVLLLCGTATAVAALAARLAGGRRTLVGVAAGLLVVLHPAAVEPACWIAARTTGLQVMWSAVSCWSFVRWRDGDGRIWLPLLATALACSSKEGAVLLPASLVALDLVRGGGWPSWRTHVPFFGLVGAYLVFRKLLLGWFTTAEEGHTLGGRADGALELLQQLWEPHGASVMALSLSWFVLLVIVVTLFDGRRRRVLWCVPWAWLLLTPGTTHVGAAADELAGRFVFDAVPALALLLALACGAGLRRLSTGGTWVILALIILQLGSGSRHWRGRYDDDAAVIASAQQQLLEQASAAAPGRPFGVVGLPGLPLLQPALWGFLTQRPFADRDLPVVGLSNILTRNPAAEGVFTDTAAIHALVGDGAGSSVWNTPQRRLTPVASAAPDVIEFVAHAAVAGQFAPPRLLPPTAVAVLEIVAPSSVKRWRVDFLGNLGGDYAAPAHQTTFGDDGHTTLWVDATSVLPWFVAATLGGGPAGIAVTCDGAPAPVGTIVRAHPRLAALPLHAVGLPAVVDRAELARHLVRPVENGLYVLYLLLPTGLYSWEVTEHIELRVPDDVAAQIAFTCDVLGPCRAHWFWRDLLELPPPGGAPGRTPFGTIILR